MKKILLLALFLGLVSSCKKNENPIAAQEHFEAEGLFLLNTKKDTVIYYFQGKLRSGDTLSAQLNSVSENLDVYFLDATKKTINPPIDEPDHSLGIVVVDTSIVKVELSSGLKYSIKHTGKKLGSTSLELQLLHLGHPDFRTIPIPIKVK